MTQNQTALARAVTAHASHLLFIAVFVAMLVSLGGCSDTSAEEDHLEHHVPAHKPATFVAAIPDLARRHDHMRNGMTQQQLVELRDIIQWLPELAAATDLKKPDWDRVLQIANAMERLVAAWDKQPVVVPQAESAEFGRQVQELQPLAEKLSSKFTGAAAKNPE